MLTGANTIPCATEEEDGELKTVVTMTSAEYFSAKSSAKSKARSADFEPSIATRIFLNKRIHNIKHLYIHSYIFYLKVKVLEQKLTLKRGNFGEGLILLID